MADQFLQNYKQSFSLADMDPNMEFLNHFSGLNPSYHQLSANMETNFPGLFIHDDISVLPPFSDQPIILNGINDRKRKAIETSTPESSCAYSSPQVSDNGSRKTNGGGKKGKKVKCNEKELREVIHVRAKRGEATDSHSLAERVRRGKINERLRCLQDIVPGCYKSMGMALMLDEIINYVQSLQSQVEFLSMKLTAASAFHDFNSDTDAMEALQRGKTYGALKVENVGNQEGLPSALGFDSLGLNFGHFS